MPSLWLACAALFALVLIAYATAFGLGFAMDGSRLLGDPRIHVANASTLQLIVGHHYWWPTPVDRLYRPLTTASLLFNYAVLGNGAAPVGYHCVNILLHAANVGLAFALGMRVFRRPRAAFFAAALWAVHPICTEAVANVAGRADLLAAMSVLAGLLLYARVLESSGRSFAVHALALFCVAALGLLSKENAAVLIGLMLLWDMAFAGANWRQRIGRRAAAYSAAGAALLVVLFIRHVVLSAEPWPQALFVDNPMRAAGLWAARFTAVKVIGFDLLLLVWPLQLASDRAYNEIAVANAADVAAWVALAVIAGISCMVVVRRRRDAVIFWGAGFFAIALVPVSNLIITIGSIMAERFLYLPSLGFAVAVTALLDRVKRRRLVHVTFAVIIALFTARTLVRNLDWKDDLTLGLADVRTAPGNFRLHDIAANALYDRHGPAAIDRAIAAGEKAWEILRPLPPHMSYQQTPAQLGLYYMVKADLAGGSSPEARAWNRRALEVLLKARDISAAIEKAFDRDQLAHGRPVGMRLAYQPVYRNLAMAHARLGLYQESISAYRYAIDLNPSVATVYEQLASLFRFLGDSRSEAVTLLERVAVAGVSPAVVNALEVIYGKESCALTRERGAVGLNFGCPEVRRDMCRAWANVAEHYQAARLHAGVRGFRDAMSKNGCPAMTAPFGQGI